MNRSTYTRLAGKGIKKIMKLRGGGSALPGLVVEKIDPSFLSRTLSDLPYGIAIVTGTNGKTTTTKMVTQLLRAHGLKVFTNPSGSNFTRGIVASLIDKVDTNGKLDADVAVLELDEAHAVHFVKQVQPQFTLVLNILRDQLDRFGEIDYTAGLLRKVVDATQVGVVLNREDDLVSDLSPRHSDVQVRYFGLGEKVLNLFPSDAEMHNSKAMKYTSKPPISDSDVILHSFEGRSATFALGEKLQTAVNLKIDGAYNVLNAAGALALARLVVGADTKQSQTLLKELEEVRPAFGRGEAITIDGDPLEIVLVKNPSGFRLALHSYANSPAETMIAINDNYADGRDMSWLWDVPFDSLSPGIAMVSGTRAYDMALRLQYDLVDVSQVTLGLPEAIREFIKRTGGKRRIYCTYTAMLAIRRELAKTHTLEPIE
ncbi:Mur ligase family protein [Patescibacteria group bacterium]|nr:MAG: Mur ligase family protein [Patescibacteria group bacterium]